MVQIYCHRREDVSNLPLVIGSFIEDTISDSNMFSFLKDMEERGHIAKGHGAINKIFTFGNISNEIVYIIGLGEKNRYDLKKFKSVFKKAADQLGDNIIIDLPTFIGDLNEKKASSILVESLVYNNYRFDRHRNEKGEKELNVGLITNNNLSETIEEAYVLGVAISNTRDLVNEPYNFLNAEDLANYAINLVQSINNEYLSIKIYDKEEIEKLKMGAFLGVNLGSTAAPKLIHINYHPTASDYIGLVGKGIMFDTGGYSLKTSMNNMKDDMAGAATVLGVLEVVAKNRLPVNIQVIICATDNRINGHALLPDDVIAAMNGKTIEIISTDAEGRLTLADGICFAQKEGCKKVIDVATLTGAIVSALGEDITGVFGNDKNELQQLIDASDEAMEEFWVMPINEGIRDKVRASKVADISNATGRLMGASGAAAFLEEFVEEGTKWLHLDIAGTAFRETGATGASLATLYHYIKKQL